ncbi:hypothetical protein [Variovorax terrae]|uniref:Uncharacterized protein n=1 Tax=Variovorax terrae TaxID=2923278 RepID=A0A9X1VTM4_9BURK|nr:hypothetical protein [Variovorax terrae]MCJ0763616.1 hypothetical protein [Variovorax terrae]
MKPGARPATMRDVAAAGTIKALVLLRIRAQRERLEAISPAPAAAVAQPSDTAGQAPGASAPNVFPRSMIMRTLIEHPAAAGAILATGLALGPRRLLQWSRWLLPLMLWRR